MLKRTFKNTITLFLFINSLLLISACTPKTKTKNNSLKENSIDLVIRKNNKQVKLPKDSSYDIKKKEFIPLKNIKELEATTTYGKTDPFSEYSDSSSNILSSNLKLKGIISTPKLTYALVEFKGNGGSIKEGEIGGKDTPLLPNGVKVKEIDVNKQSAILLFKGKKYELSY